MCIFFSFFFHLFLLVGGQLPYNIVVVFAVHRHESVMGVPVSHHPEPPPSSLPTLFLVVPEHQPWVPRFMHRICAGDLFHIL